MIAGSRHCYRIIAYNVYSRSSFSPTTWMSCGCQALHPCVQNVMHGTMWRPSMCHCGFASTSRSGNRTSTSCDLNIYLSWRPKSLTCDEPLDRIDVHSAQRPETLSSLFSGTVSPDGGSQSCPESASRSRNDQLRQVYNIQRSNTLGWASTPEIAFWTKKDLQWQSHVVAMQHCSSCCTFLFSQNLLFLVTRKLLIWLHLRSQTDWSEIA